MNRFLFFLLLNFAFTSARSQNFSGQWKGTFIDKSTSMYSWGDDKCDYVLDLEVIGNDVNGYSYTYFTSEGNKYFTICKLVGKVDKARKYVEITETERTKTNIPSKIINSFQIHKLTWRKEGENEILAGNWIPAPGQDKTNTGFGTTLLSKRQLTEISPLAKRLNAKNKSPERPLASNNIKPKILPVTKKPTATVAKNPVVKKTNPTVRTFTKPNMAAAKIDSGMKNVVINKNITPRKEIVGFEKRSSNVIQTINVINDKVKLELYDNGDIDGDSVSIFYNGQVLLSHKKLTDQAIKLDLPVNDNDENELVMYADNLGTIPPNTALMIVTDGNKRYEVRITSDLKKSGVIKFVHVK
jgi:hypothetical protein